MKHARPDLVRVRLKTAIESYYGRKLNWQLLAEKKVCAAKIYGIKYVKVEETLLLLCDDRIRCEGARNYEEII